MEGATVMIQEKASIQVGISAKAQVDSDRGFHEELFTVSSWRIHLGGL